MRSCERLRPLQNQPQLLIPPQLLTTCSQPSKIGAASFEVELGRLDQEYTPDLAVIIFRKAGHLLESSGQEQPDTWDQVLRYQHQIALQKKVLEEADQPLLSIIATEYCPQGVEVAGYIQATPLRKSGIGRAFFAHFEKLLQEMGYEHLWGSHNKDNIGFFRKIGRYTIDQLTPNALTDNGLPPIPYYDLAPGIAAIKFLDKDLEKACVKPEFLRL